MRGRQIGETKPKARYRMLSTILPVVLACVVMITGLTGCSSLSQSASSGLQNGMAPAEIRVERTGIASYLSDEFHGQLTASGVPYDKNAMVAAHPSLPFETQVIVTRLDTGQAITVTIVDRLPEKVESIIDISSAAAIELEMLESGETNVRLDVISAAQP